ncbi:L-glutamate gamma-semialdehyde dehydrogenase [candidate division KSB1 bacterium]|nr:L-glutamate gamma-semialdehyde dehydrogenase [candidate division KSB1 bacterium]
MPNGIFDVPYPINEPIYDYNPGSSEKAELKNTLDDMLSKEIEIPMVIGGEDVKSGNLADCRCPHDHKHLLGQYHKGDEKYVHQAIEAALEARKQWAETPWEARAAIFLKAAELLAGPYRQLLNASTMLGQSKNVFQAEIDAACEIVDFLRFNVYYMQQLYGQQVTSEGSIWNQLEYRPLEGFVFAVTPFNFTSIAANLPTAPALMGNVVVWKPASSSVYSAYYIMEWLKEAGMPAGVINMVPGPGSAIGDPAMNHPRLAGVHFTGSTATFQGMWKTVGGNIEKYKSYPRIVGETGGKNFLFVHSSADTKAVATAAIRGAFEYQGQKCSAASRMYVPESLWPSIKEFLLAMIKEIKMGDVTDFTNFMNAVIDKNSFRDITEYIDYAKNASDAEILHGGEYDDSKGYFIQPTIIQTKTPKFKTMEEEIFGPVLTVYVYPDNQYEQTLQLCDETSPYALTGAIFSQDRYAVIQASKILRNAAGNFYINDKPTGAVVGQQPFGGARASGTNDKAGSIFNLIRWVSTRTIKENFVPPKDFKYPFMQEE